MKKYLSFYYCLVLTIFPMLCAYASDSPALVGSLNKTTDEVASATDVVIGKFIEVKEGGVSSMMGELYHGQITVSESLKGNTSGNLKVSFSVIRGSKDTEAEPKLNDTYLIVLDHHTVRKLLAATDDNIAKIKALIAAAPAPTFK